MPKCFPFILSLLAALRASLPAAAETPELTFERDVRPILKTHCFLCHGEGEKLKGGVDLRLRRFLTKETEEGDPIMVPGQPGKSEMLRLVREGEMPKKGKKLTVEEIGVLERWIATGAKTLREEPAEVPKFWISEEDRAFWAFQPIRSPAVPAVQNAGRVRTPVDAFLLARMEGQGLTFAPEASKPTLLRRVTLDLTGLPPTPEETEAFAADTSPDAYEKVVDRLLASPAYGERWARHWLDVAGYADSNGFNEVDSLRPNAWRYRDYVIRSLNADKPWDRFIQEQLAGDEFARVDSTDPDAGIRTPEAADLLTATGFLRNAPDGTGEVEPDPNLARNQVVAETLKIVSSSLLGLTVGCAQCHDHRYDPISQADYYRLRAILEPALDWKKWRAPAARVVSLYTPEQRLLRDEIEAHARNVEAAAKSLDTRFRDEIFAKRLAGVPEEAREALRQVHATPLAKRTEEQKKLLKDHPGLGIDSAALKLFDAAADKQVVALNEAATKIRANKPPEPLLSVLNEPPGAPPQTFLFHRGDHDQPKERIAPGELEVVALTSPVTIPEKDPALTTSGRRLAYARHLTDGKHPLVARVLVNRFWLHHFGRGLVNTPGDFGVLGERPVQPELLDWLATQFMAGGWKLKPLHRLLVTSSAYRQAAQNEPALAPDPENKLFARFSLQRLDAETFRDSLLAACGKLNPAPFGPPVPVALDSFGRVVVGQQKINVNRDPIGLEAMGDAEFRRSVYLLVRRKQPLTVLETFDAPVMSPNCDSRSFTTVAPQSLLLMNDTFVLQTSTDLAARLRSEHAGDLRAQIDRAWRLLFGTAPTDAESTQSLLYLAEQTETIRAHLALLPAKKDAPAPDPQLLALSSLCQALVSSNRYLYVE